MTGHPQESKATLPSLRTLVNVGEGFPQSHGLEPTCITHSRRLKTWGHLTVRECCSALLLCQPCGTLRSEQPQSPDMDVSSPMAEDGNGMLT